MPRQIRYRLPLNLVLRPHLRRRVRAIVSALEGNADGLARALTCREPQETRAPSSCLCPGTILACGPKERPSRELKKMPGRT
jgi:hypothetical protein